MPRSWIWDVFLLATGIFYLANLLCNSIQCTSLAVAFVALAVPTLVLSRRERG